MSYLREAENNIKRKGVKYSAKIFLKIAWMWSGLAAFDGSRSFRSLVIPEIGVGRFLLAKKMEK